MNEDFWDYNKDDDNKKGYWAVGEPKIHILFFGKNGNRIINDENTGEWKELKPKQLEMKKYEIWIGYVHLGQGYDPSTEPQKLAEVEATSFKIACVLYEHQSAIDSLKERMARNDTYIEYAHFGSWNYDPKTNSTAWLGKYYESREEALKSFENGR